MSILDATRICSRTPVPAAAWARPAPVPERRAVVPEFTGYSWLALPANPRALLLTGLAAPLAAKDLCKELLA